MKLTGKLLLLCLGLFAMLVIAPGCGNKAGCVSDADCGSDKCVNGACVECRADSDCNANNACTVCSGNSCTQKSNCCTTDLECGQGKRCWNVPGKAYGRCGGKK